MSDGVDDHGGSEPDPDMQVVKVASGWPSDRAHLLAGRLEAEGVRAMTTPSAVGIGRWMPSLATGPAFGATSHTFDVLIDARDVERARPIIERYRA